MPVPGSDVPPALVPDARDPTGEEQAARTRAVLLSDIVLAAASEDDVDGILSVVLARLGAALDFTGGSIALVEGDELVVRASVGRLGVSASGRRLPRGRNLSWHILEKGEPFCTSDLTATRFGGGIGEADGAIRSFMGVPIISRGGAIGLLEVKSTEAAVFRAPDLTLLRAVATVLSGPVELARLRAGEAVALTASEAARRRLSIVAEASRLLGSTPESDAVLGDLSGLLVPEVADVFFVSLRARDGSVRRVAMAHADPSRTENFREALQRPGQVSRYGETILSGLRAGRALVYHDVSESLLRDAAVDEDDLRVLVGLQMRSLIVMPLMAHGEVRGALWLAMGESGRHFEPDDVTMTEELGRRAATAVERTLLYRAEQTARRAAERAAERTARLQAVTAALSEQRFASEMAPLIVQHGMEALGAVAGCLAVTTADGRGLEVLHAAGYPDRLLEDFRRFSLDAPIPLAEAARDRRIIFVGSRAEWRQRYAALEAAAPEGHHAWVAVPLTVEDVPLGAIGFSFGADRLFDAEARAFAEALAAYCAQALDRARLYEAERAAQRRTAFLAMVSDLLVASDSWEVSLQRLAELACSRVTDWCFIELLQPDGTLQRVALDGPKGAAAEAFDKLSTSLGSAHGLGVLSRAVLEQDAPQFITDFASEASPIADPADRATLHALGARSVMAAPLSRRGQVFGAITFVATSPDTKHGPVELRFLDDLAARIAMAVDAARLYGELRQFKTTLDTTLDSVFMFDPSTLRFFYVNQGAIDSVGYSRAELLQMTPFDLEPEFEETRFRALLEPLLQGTRNSTTVSTTHRHKSGRDFPIEMFMQYVEPRDEPGRVIAIVRDITDRVQARARLQRLAQSERALNAELKTIIRAMGDGVLVFSSDGAIMFANPAAEGVLAEGRFARWTDVIQRLIDPDGLAPLLGVKDPQGPVELALAGQNERWLELTAFPIFTPVETVSDAPEPDEGVETILFLRDVTEARRARLARDAFIGVLSHELRTPVTTIFGNSKLLARTDTRLGPEVRQEAYRDIETESERLYRLVEDLLVLARYGEDSTREGANEPLLLQRIVPAVIRSEQPRWPGRTFDAFIPANLPAVEGDQTYVEQVLRNLLSNAAKYGDEGGRVRIVLKVVQDEVSVRVLDEGPGFSAEESDRLFELFYRSPHAVIRASGAGIGLFVCRRLVEAMGGRIWARPRESGGAEFGFVLNCFFEERA